MFGRTIRVLVLGVALGGAGSALAQGSFLGGMSGGGSKPAPAPEAPPPAPDPAPIPAPPRPEATAPIKPDAAPANAFVGSWSGNYTCAQGRTAIDLDITGPINGEMSAIASFYALADNPGVPSGSFKLYGPPPAPGDRRMSLYPDSWINRPPGYGMVGADLEITADGNAIGGRLTGAPGCTTIILGRR